MNNVCKQHGKLETHIEYIRAKLDEIVTDLDEISESQKKILGIKDRVKMHTWILGGIIAILTTLITVMVK